MKETMLHSNWQEKIIYGKDGPEPVTLLETGKAKVVLAGLKAGQQIPDHPEAESIYHFLEGDGWMIVDGAKIAVTVGETLTMPAGSARGMKTGSQLAFLAVRIS